MNAGQTPQMHPSRYFEDLNAERVSSVVLRGRPQACYNQEPPSRGFQTSVKQGPQQKAPPRTVRLTRASGDARGPTSLQWNHLREGTRARPRRRTCGCRYADDPPYRAATQSRRPGTLRQNSTEPPPTPANCRWSPPSRPCGMRRKP